MDAGIDAGVDAGFDAGFDADAAALLPIRDGDIRCESTECRSVAGNCCGRVDGTRFCCGGRTRCDRDSGVCECNGGPPCELGLLCCGPNDAGLAVSDCVGADTHARVCEGHSPP